eukprot:TRINITY_DN30177_c0_g1_i1.p1 TRINITY_DN30177_c0_g1~~TRINITY_DN30177_c0_g1_i1.p1  ORF type:complete len:116 (-),score=14.12 TRINITY_DN30177_c0_g1_i1:19-366(-)
MKSVLLLHFVQIVLLVLAAEGRKGKSRPERWWHIAESEEGCGNYTQLLREERPSDLCLELSSYFCICTTRTEPSLGSTEWQYKCGTCEIKWRRDRTQDASVDNASSKFRKLGKVG